MYLIQIGTQNRGGGVVILDRKYFFFIINLIQNGRPSLVEATDAESFFICL
jgi:hypothetical protein